MTGTLRSKLLTTAAAAGLAATFAVGGALAADPVPQNDLLNATLWVTNSVEYKANAMQAYRPRQDPPRRGARRQDLDGGDRADRRLSGQAGGGHPRRRRDGDR